MLRLWPGEKGFLQGPEGRNRNGPRLVPRRSASPAWSLCASPNLAVQLRVLRAGTAAVRNPAARKDSDR